MRPRGVAEIARQQAAAALVAAKRAIRLDDLLHLALEADRALGSVSRDDLRTTHPQTSQTLFERALERIWEADQRTQQWTTRWRLRMQAAALTQFSELLRSRLQWPISTEQLLTQAHRLSDGTPPDVQDRCKSDLIGELEVRLRRGRQQRIAGQYPEAEALLDRRSTDILGTGAEGFYADYQFQRIAALIEQGRAAEADDIDAECASVWRDSAAMIASTRHRVDYAVGLALLAREQLPEAIERIDQGYQLLRLDVLRGTRRADLAFEVDLLSLLLGAVAARLELLQQVPKTSSHEVVLRTSLQTVTCLLLAEAVELLSGLRARWRVVSRTRSPLSIAFRRIYGEIAIMAARLATADAARLGLLVAVTAKQTGFAALLREGQLELVGEVRDLVRRIVAAEDALDRELPSEAGHADALTRLQGLRKQLLDELSPLLADLILPEDRTLTQLFQALDGRWALDYLKIADVYGTVHWFSSLVAPPDGSVSFHELTLGPHCKRFLYGSETEQALCHDMIDLPADDPIWTALAGELLPRALRNLPSSVDAEIELVISAHDELGYVPWPALRLANRNPLITAALITQTPMLACLTGFATRPVSGTAVVCLTSHSDSDRPSLDVRLESLSWNLGEPDPRSAVYRCWISNAENAKQPVALSGSLTEVLSDATAVRSFQLAHVAGLGSGSGLAQAIGLRSGSLTAGHALSLHWPRTVILRACHVGVATNLQDAEPHGMVMALFAGGAQSVITGLLEISDSGSGAITSEIIGALARGIRPEVALRQQQVEHSGEAVYRWGLLGSYAI